jgi:recombination protein RecA
MDIRRIAAIKDNTGDVIGNRTKVKVVKNKLAPPFKIAEFDINYSEGISRAGSILDVALDYGIVEKRGSWFSYNGEQLGQGREPAKTAIATNKELGQKILKAIKEKRGVE